VFGQVPVSADLFNNGLYGLLYTGILLGLAITIFDRREF
jgi:hypothetical protein